MSLSDLEALTGAADLQRLNLGESIVKYRGVYRGEKVVLRIYPRDDYYGCRFDREGAALRAIWKIIDERDAKKFIIVPVIIKEWSETTRFGPVRALKWIEGSSFQKIASPLDPAILTEILEILEQAGQYMPDKFSFRKDFLALFDQATAVGEWKSEEWQLFTSLSAEILKGFKSVHFNENALIHGDFHYGNILQVSGAERKQNSKYALVDWEFATRGSRFFDLAYLHVFSGWEPSCDLKQKTELWKGLALAVIAHWYLINMPHSNNVRIWLKKLEGYINER